MPLFFGASEFFSNLLYRTVLSVGCGCGPTCGPIKVKDSGLRPCIVVEFSFYQFITVYSRFIIALLLACD